MLLFCWSVHLLLSCFPSSVMLLFCFSDPITLFCYSSAVVRVFYCSAHYFLYVVYYFVFLFCCRVMVVSCSVVRRKCKLRLLFTALARVISCVRKALRSRQFCPHSGRESTHILCPRNGHTLHTGLRRAQFCEPPQRESCMGEAPYLQADKSDLHKLPPRTRSSMCVSRHTHVTPKGLQPRTVCI